MSDKTAEEILAAMPPTFRAIAVALGTIEAPDGWVVGSRISPIAGAGISVRSPGGFEYLMGYSDYAWSCYSDEWEEHGLDAQEALDKIVEMHTARRNATDAWRDDAALAIEERDFDLMEACLRQALARLDHSTAEVGNLLDHLSKMRGGGSPLERLVGILRDAYPGVG